MGQTQSNPVRDRSGKEVGSRNRELAKKEAGLRRDLSQQSQTAWAQNNKAKAKELSNASKVHQTRMEAYNALAAAEIFRANNPIYHHSTRSGASFLFGLFSGTSVASALAEIDLHGLHVTEALPMVQEHLRLCRSNGVGRTTIITGKGLHSVDKVAKIRPQVEKMLAEERVKVVREAGKVNEGAFVVEFAEEGEEVGWAGWFLAGLFGQKA
ncbi:uncharacterized protein LAJ45_09115 [Morchella importuna]|uniref:Smr-domain-containing protein n=1 Tax=Morchella conica CCBAS932 TaxID=1392247 RepID=A0A3N4KPP4_9PEZI|nr:uncharacterized protein LAJ45_09115 [Morchella importuna]KAH8146741.1 hypothetical protein LAJ45_09115 [Morchella importuna]RPB12573.1 Smr-domain-containing protein [Morchella conica CCBAS932]